MYSTPHKLASEDALYAAALRALARRAYSVFEMRAYLEERSEDSQWPARVLARLRQERLMDDARFALEFARWRARSRRQGRYRIARELRQRGLADKYIEAALADVFSETDEAALVRGMIERRMHRLHAQLPLTPKALASLYRMLLRAGFDAALIHSELRAAQGAKARGSLPSDPGLP